MVCHPDGLSPGWSITRTRLRDGPVVEDPAPEVEFGDLSAETLVAVEPPGEAVLFLSCYQSGKRFISDARNTKTLLFCFVLKGVKESGRRREEPQVRL